MKYLKQLLFITCLLIGHFAFAQNTTTLPSGTTSITPQFRKKAVSPDSLSRYYMNNGTGWNRVYTATELNELFRDTASIANIKLKRYVDSLSANASQSYIDVFLIAGQSNADGRGDSTKSVYAVPGTYHYYTSLKRVFRNIGSPDSKGGAMVAMANEYYRILNRNIIAVDGAVGGAAQAAAADNGTDGNWDTTGTRFNEAVTRVADAMAAATAAGLNPRFAGVIWCQGEQDGRKINEAVITKAIYKAAFVKMLRRFRAIYGANMPFYVSRIAFRNSESDAGYISVQEAQEEVAAADSGRTIIAFRDAGSFRDRGLLIDPVHYTQPGYEQMGISIARTVATGVLPPPTRFRAQDEWLALGNRLVATANVDILDSLNRETKPVQYINSSLGTAALPNLSIANGTDPLDQFRLGLTGKNFSGSAAFAPNSVFFEARANLDAINIFTRKTAAPINFYIAGNLESARKFTVNANGAWVRGGNASALTPSTLANTFVIENPTTPGLSFLGTTSASIYFGNGITNDAARMQYDYVNKYMRFYTNSTEAFRVDSNQNIALGSPSTTPLGTLDISQGSGFALTLGSSSSGKQRFNNTTKIARIGIANYTNSAIPFLSFMGQSTVSSNDLFLGGGSSVGYAATTIRFLLGANNTTTTGTEYGRFTPSGLRLGDGGTATATLELKAHTTGAGTAPLKFEHNASVTMTTAELGAWEFAVNNLRFTPTGTTRMRVPLTTDVTPSNGQLMIGNGSYFSTANLTSSYGNTIVNGAGTIAINVDTTAAIGVVSKTRLTNSLLPYALKASPVFTGVLTTPAIRLTNITDGLISDSILVKKPTDNKIYKIAASALSAPDTTVYRTVLNSWSKAQADARYGKLNQGNTWASINSFTSGVTLPPTGYTFGSGGASIIQNIGGLFSFSNSTANSNYVASFSLKQLTAHRIYSLPDKSDTLAVVSQVPTQLKDFYTNAGNSGSSETDLYSYTTAANRLANNGEKLQAEFSGSFVGSGTDTRQIRVYFGSATVFFDTGALVIPTSSAWTMKLTIIRTSGITARFACTLHAQDAPKSSYVTSGELTGITLSTTNILKITGTSAGVSPATNDILATSGNIKWEPAAP